MIFGLSIFLEFLGSERKLLLEMTEWVNIGSSQKEFNPIYDLENERGDTKSNKNFDFVIYYQIFCSKV